PESEGATRIRAPHPQTHRTPATPHHLSPHSLPRHARSPRPARDHGCETPPVAQDQAARKKTNLHSQPPAHPTTAPARSASPISKPHHPAPIAATAAHAARSWAR